MFLGNNREQANLRHFGDAFSFVKEEASFGNQNQP